MIDPMVSLAFSVFSNRGVYALLLGSGISTGAGIPTGYQIVELLIRKVATLSQEEIESNPIAWFKKKFGVEPNYSSLLDQIGGTPAERHGMLREYFEPSEEEKKEGKKIPSQAHKAIAKLASSGYIKVILTTNFDSLLEQAFEAEGLPRNVISTVDQLKGATPIVHQSTTIIKLNGDYLDTRIKNTVAELSKYDDEVNLVLDKIFDEYGLIISGWSAEYDVALCKAIERCPNRRYSTFWNLRSKLSKAAEALCNNRSAVKISSNSADDFFQSLLEKVKSLEDINAPHPLSAKIAAATTKRYIIDPLSRIKLHDLVFQETEKICSILKSPKFNLEGQIKSQDFRNLVQNYESMSEIMISIMIPGIFWGDKDSMKLWTSSIQMIANSSCQFVTSSHSIQFNKFPAFLLFYASSLAAIAANDYEKLISLFNITIQDNFSGMVPIYLECIPERVIGEGARFFLPSDTNEKHRIHKHYFNFFRNLLKEFLPQDSDYREAYEKLEYIISLMYRHHMIINKQPTQWTPLGFYFFEPTRHRPKNMNIIDLVKQELDAKKNDWHLLRAGFFEGNLDSARRAINGFESYINAFFRR